MIPRWHSTSLKARVGLGTILEDIPKHLPLVQGRFALSDLIYGPLDAIPHGSNKFDMSSYRNPTDVKNMNRKRNPTDVKNMNRKKLFEII